MGGCLSGPGKTHILRVLESMIVNTEVKPHIEILL